MRWHLADLVLKGAMFHSRRVADGCPKFQIEEGEIETGEYRSAYRFVAAGKRHTCSQLRCGVERHWDSKRIGGAVPG